MAKKIFFALVLALFSACAVYADEDYIVEMRGGMLRAYSDDGMESIGNNMYTTDRETAERLLKSGAAVDIEPDIPLIAFDVEEREVSALEAAHSDEYYSGQIYMQKMGIEGFKSTHPCNTRIALIDSGVNMSHPDLAGVNFLAGYNFVDKNDDLTDTVNHGTRVAAVIAADNDNGIGVAGIVPDAEILPLVAITSSGGSVSSLIQAINYAVDEQSCKVLNISLGAETYSQMLEKTVNSAVQKGAVIICAAGNEGKSTPTYPAYFENTISVGAVTGDMQLTTYTRRSGHIDAAVPYEKSYLPNRYGSYTYGAGTSFACPVITSIAAILVSEYPNKNVNDIRDILKAVSADVCDSGRDDSGFGVPQCGDIEKYLSDRYDIYISPFYQGEDTLVKVFAKNDKDGLMLIKAVFAGDSFLRYETEEIKFDEDDMFYTTAKLNYGESLRLFVWDSFEAQKCFAKQRQQL